ncbi:MAG: SDR family oxidoreductase [Parvularculales bacterium]
MTSATSEQRPVALITGAARRIGRAMALYMASNGWAVALHYNTSGDEATSLAQNITNNGGHAVAIQADLADSTAVDNLIPSAMRAFSTNTTNASGAVSCLINNASLFERDTLDDITPGLWQRHMDINLRAPVFLTQSFARHLPDSIEGDVINLIDQRVQRLTPLFYSYTLSKAGLWTATRTAAQALAPKIRVNAVAPGSTLPSSHQSDEHFQRLQESVPLQHGATVDELCQAVQFILSSPGMTGQMIILDGGQHLAWKMPDILTALE